MSTIKSTAIARKLYSTAGSKWNRELFMAAHMNVFIANNSRIPDTQDYNQIQWDLIQAEIEAGLIHPETAEKLNIA